MGDRSGFKQHVHVDPHTPGVVDLIMLLSGGDGRPKRLVHPRLVETGRTSPGVLSAVQQGSHFQALRVGDLASGAIISPLFELE